MALTLKDRVLETCTAPGTGSVSLLGAVTGYQSFSSAIGNANTCYYTIADQSGANWEVGIGTYTSSGNTLARTTVLSSSNGGSLTNFASGTQNVFVTYPSEEAVYSNGTNIVGPSGIPLAVGNGGTGLTSLTSGYIPYGNGTSAYSFSSGFTFVNNVLTAPILIINSTTSTTPNLTFNASNSGFTSGASVSGSYLQTVIQNRSGTAGASTNYVLSNDLGTDSSYYGEFGMNSSVYSSGTPTDFYSINNGIYFSGHDGDITFGSGNGFKSYFAWGSSGQSAHVINAVGALGFSTNLGTTPALSGTTGFGTSGYLLQTAGSTGAPSWVAQSTITAGNATNAVNTGITLTTTGATNYITFVTATSGNLPQLVNSSITANAVNGTITGGIAGGAF